MNKYRKDFSPDIVCLFETRISRARADGIISKIGYRNSFQVEANGFAGGIWICWNDNFLVDMLDIHSQVIHLKVNSKQGSDNIFCSAVYASLQPTKRRKLWQLLVFGIFVG